MKSPMKTATRTPLAIPPMPNNGRARTLFLARFYLLLLAATAAIVYLVGTDGFGWAFTVMFALFFAIIAPAEVGNVADQRKITVYFDSLAGVALGDLVWAARSPEIDAERRCAIVRYLNERHAGWSSEQRDPTTSS